MPFSFLVSFFSRYFSFSDLFAAFSFFLVFHFNILLFPIFVVLSIVCSLTVTHYPSYSRTNRKDYFHFLLSFLKSGSDISTGLDVESVFNDDDDDTVANRSGSDSVEWPFAQRVVASIHSKVQRKVSTSHLLSLS